MVEGGGFWAREAESEATKIKRLVSYEDGINAILIILNEFFANFTFNEFHSFCFVCQPISVVQLAECQAEIVTIME